MESAAHRDLMLDAGFKRNGIGAARGAGLSLPCMTGRPDKLPLVYTIVLNWNRPELTLRCLASLDAVEYANHEVVVVDNGSTDDSVLRIRERYPPLRIIETGANLGYAGGNNVGIRAAHEAGADYVLMLNNDAVLTPGCIGTLVAAAEADTAAGALSPKIMRFDGGIAYEGASFDRRLAYVSRHRGPTSTDAPVDVGFAPGTSLLIRMTAIQQTGLLDESFFLYWEDVEYSHRLTQHGWRLLYVPTALVHHEVGGSSDEPGAHTSAMDYYNTRNFFWFVRRNHRLRDRLPAETYYFVYVLKRLRRIISSEQRKVTKLSALARGVIDGHLGRTKAMVPQLVDTPAFADRQK